MSLPVFYYCICVCLRRCRSFTPSLCRLSPFHLPYVAVSRPCPLSEFTLTGPTLTFKYITSSLSFTASMTSDSNGIFRVLPKLYCLVPVIQTKFLSV